jgi:hypothetical protein
MVILLKKDKADRERKSGHAYRNEKLYYRLMEAIEDEKVSPFNGNGTGRHFQCGACEQWWL